MSPKTEVILELAAEVPSTRQRLLEAGLLGMRRHGYGATGLQEILQAAGVPKGSFYHHFDSKEEFTSEVIKRYAALEGEHCREVLGNSRQAPLNRLRRYFEDLIRTAGPSASIQGCLIGGLSLEVARDSPLLQDCLSSSFAHWQAAIANVLREAVAIGELPASTRPETLADFMLNSWQGSLLRSQAEKSDAALKDYLYYVFGVLLTK